MTDTSSVTSASASTPASGSSSALPSATPSRVRLYAEAMAKVGEAEGNLDEIADEIFRFAGILAQNDELREALGDRRIPAQRRQQIVEDLLEGKVSKATASLVSMVVAADRTSDFSAIAQSLADVAAHSKSAEVAYVRTASELTPEQVARLEEALSKATGKSIEVKATVDPSVIGGVIATVGDTIIDGSVRSRITRMRESFA